MIQKECNVFSRASNSFTLTQSIEQNIDATVDFKFEPIGQ